jgi:uncharacterized phage protein gp47/JayE
MPVQNGDYVKLTEDDIQDALEDELQSEFGQNIDLTESSVFSTLTEVLGAVLSENQEQSIQEVYRSAFIETATGDDLNRVVALLGLQRRDAVHATGVERFEASGKVEQDYVIQNGTTVQTLGADPIEFETTEAVRLELIDNFEDSSLSEYSGDTSNASIVSTNVYEGSNALQMDATAGAHIYDDAVELDQGTTFHGHARPTAGTVPIFTFGVQSADPTDHYQVAFDEAADEVRLEVVENGSVTSTVDTATITINAGAYYEAEIDWNITDNIGVTVKDANENELGTLGGSDATYQRGAAGFKSGDANGTKNFDFYTTSARSADIRAVEGGVEGNVGANALESVPSPPAGVQTATNPYPTGDQTYFDTSGNLFRVGQDEETDRELRERALDTTSGGGSATHDAIVGHLINTIEDVTSVTLFENKTDDDNTGTGGLPPHAFEAVVFGGSDKDVAEAIFEKKAVTAHDYAGVNGTAVTETVVAETNGQEREITFSRPNAINVDMTLDLVVNDNYIGDDPLKDRIVRYIGGTLSNGTDTVGLGVSEDVIIDSIRDIVVGADDTGVIAFDNSVDGTPLETTPSSTTVDGIEVIDIGAVEVAQTSAEDASITLNTRQ